MAVFRTCGKCGKPLRDPESLHRGYGPECWTALQVPHERRTGRAGEPVTDYAFHLNGGVRVPVLVIEDLDRGGRSVTNNVGAVLSQVAVEIGLGAYLMPIVYRDSAGRYDGIDGMAFGKRGGVFYPIGAETEEEAVRIALERSVFL